VPLGNHSLGSPEAAVWCLHSSCFSIYHGDQYMLRLIIMTSFLIQVIQCKRTLNAKCLRHLTTKHQRDCSSAMSINMATTYAGITTTYKSMCLQGSCWLTLHLHPAQVCLSWCSNTTGARANGSTCLWLPLQRPFSRL